jgi:hypothetical protein
LSKKKPTTTETIDTGTKEFNKRHRVVPFKMRNSILVKALDTTAADRAMMNGVIDPSEHSAVLAFEKDCYVANLIGPHASDYGKPIGTGARHEISTREAEALQTVGRALSFLTQRVGAQARSAVYAMVMEDRDCENPTLVKNAASSLMEFYSKFSNSRRPAS